MQIKSDIYPDVHDIRTMDGNEEWINLYILVIILVVIKVFTVMKNTGEPTGYAGIQPSHLQNWIVKTGIYGNELDLASENFGNPWLSSVEVSNASSLFTEFGFSHQLQRKVSKIGYVDIDSWTTNL